LAASSQACSRRRASHALRPRRADVSRLLSCSASSTTPARHRKAEARVVREVLRDRLFLGLWTLNFLFVAAGYSLINLLPPFIRDQSHVTEKEIGFIFFFNTITIVLAQLPMSRAIEGRRRLRALSLMPFLWAIAWLGVDATYWA
jgi:predicted MFS family arabinose efflux permease